MTGQGVAGAQAVPGEWPPAQAHSGSGGSAPRRPLRTARPRLVLLVKVAATAGDFSPGLARAVASATDEEVRIMSDLVDRGLSIPELVSFLQGAHLLIGDVALYERWIFASSRPRLSSHHRTVDKSRFPDYGYEGPLVGAALYGRTSWGTWVQLERTGATFRPGRLPTWTDLIHLRDYVIYRVTGRNVGPWGLSAHVDTRPMILRPEAATPGHGARAGLAAFSRRRATMTGDADELSLWADALTPDVPPIGPAGALFAAPPSNDPLDLLPDAPYRDDLGLGIFGGLPLVATSVPLPDRVLPMLDAPAADWQLRPPNGAGEVVSVPMGRRSLRVRSSSGPTGPTHAALLQLQEDPE